MPITKELRRIKGFIEHGVRFPAGVENEEQAVGDCPWCGKKKFFVNTENRLWDCKACGKSGNFEKFLALVCKNAEQSFGRTEKMSLFRDRGLMPNTFEAWGVGWSGEFYTIPMIGNPTGQTTDIHRYFQDRHTALSTTGAHLSMFHAKELFNSQQVWLCEGEWDAMALWECLRSLGVKEDVWALPGASSSTIKSAETFRGKQVMIVFDSDPPGERGMIKAGKLISAAGGEVKYLKWPEGVPVGYDIREFWVSGVEQNATEMKEKIDSWLVDTLEDNKPKVEPKFKLTGPGMSAKKVRKAFRKWLHLPNTDALDVMFGTVLANRLPGDPLWMFLVSPPGGSKSELLMSLVRAPLIHSTTSLTPQALVSGASFGGGDPSLIPRLDGKVLVVKDFTTIMSMNPLARDEIFGILRDAYDGRIEKEFGNGIRRKFVSSFGVLAGVTSIIEMFSQMNSALGERFLKYRIKHPGTENLSTEVVWQALKNVAKENVMRDDLQEIGLAVLDRAVNGPPIVSDEIIKKFIGLAQWIAMMRGVVSRERYTGQVNFKPMTEIGTRLAKQFCKLAMGIAMFRDEAEVTGDVYKIVRDCAASTAPDRIEEVVKQMYVYSPEEYATSKTISEWSKFPVDSVRYWLEDMTLLKMVKLNKHQQTKQYMLTPKLLKILEKLELYEEERAWHDARLG